ncbi:hypothetical protein N781_11560 [Pontibacillus halophilus JSM 076056 = DSM 19796]|uniref:Carbonic anhydrase n=1 Tax=Pontibacillus halophilus JSM 076056 = DSM 19796 TaxID=1385510 RepID=A0A0A5G9T9_9BACI|nr:carbonic anhydrase [Pontibacillus halophilus]KGX87885.1 hypothetical protein N781_11560 [Pontibacillus halophilus JSM 076056 = DSM 19796]
MSSKQFSTVINCMDGRVQLPVNTWMQERYGAPYVDTITEAGPNNILVNGTEAQLASMKEKVRISVEAHGSEVLAIVGHHDCAGNPVSREIQEQQIREGISIVKGWGFPITVIGLFVNENWEVEEV